MSLRVWVGPMFSEKTSHLNKHIGAHLAIIPGLVGIIISPKKDTRSTDAKQPLTSHNPTFYGPPKNIREIVVVEKLSEIDVIDIDVIGIDEAHFFPDLAETIEMWIRMGKHIYVAGLDGNFKMKKFEDDENMKFGQVSELLHISDTFEKLTGVCTICLQNSSGIVLPSSIPRAPFTARITKEDGEVVIGGSEKYICVCREHHHQYYK